MKILLNVLLALLFTGFFSACAGDKTCTESTETLLNIGFYTLSEGEVIDTMLPGFNAYGVLSDSGMVYDSVSNVNSIELPFSPHTNEISYVLTFSMNPDDIAYQDTLVVTYERELEFVSTACGFIQNISIMDVELSNNMVQADSVVKTEIIPADEEHIKIYL